MNAPPRIYRCPRCRSVMVKDRLLDNHHYCPIHDKEAVLAQGHDLAAIKQMNDEARYRLANSKKRKRYRSPSAAGRAVNW